MLVEKIQTLVLIVKDRQHFFNPHGKLLIDGLIFAILHIM
jgi:hypothetical protein